MYIMYQLSLTRYNLVSDYVALLYISTARDQREDKSYSC